MGNGIAQVAACAGLEVVLRDVSRELLEKASEAISRRLEREVEKKRLTVEETDRALKLIKLSTDSAALSEVDFVIEAVTEDVGTKTKVLRELAGITRPEVVLATNTSSISITRLAAATGRPERF